MRVPAWMGLGDACKRKSLLTSMSPLAGRKSFAKATHASIGRRKAMKAGGGGALRVDTGSMASTWPSVTCRGRLYTYVAAIAGPTT